MLPWECMYDGEEFIAAGSNTGMTRLPLEIPLQKDPPSVVLPIKMLALLSSPVDYKLQTNYNPKITNHKKSGALQAYCLRLRRKAEEQKIRSEEEKHNLRCQAKRGHQKQTGMRKTDFGVEILSKKIYH